MGAVKFERQTLTDVEFCSGNREWILVFGGGVLIVTRPTEWIPLC
jgi:hypothetical protein